MKLVLFLVLPVAAAGLSWAIGLVWWRSTSGTGLDGAQTIFWTAVMLSVPVAAIVASRLRGPPSGRAVLGIAAGILVVVFVGLSFVVLLVLHPPS